VFSSSQPMKNVAAAKVRIASEIENNFL
ncbi:hypothetical protein LCGC14_2778240, partial [marine sediment metagenome]